MAGTGMKHILKEGPRFVFGPVLSRRLGLSLGVDMVPKKTCTYDCIYCEVGPTTTLSTEPQYFYDPQDIISEIETSLKSQRPDVLTFGGSGEPLLNLALKEVLMHIKKRFQIKTALLTNGILFLRQELHGIFPYLDLVLPTVSAGSEETLRELHRPHPSINHHMLKEAMTSLRRAFKGEIWAEVMLVDGVNDSKEEWGKISSLLSHLKPQRIQVGTVERPPAYKKAHPVTEKTIQEACSYLGNGAEPILRTPKKDFKKSVSITTLLETLRRRPLQVEELRYWIEENGLEGVSSLESLERELGLIKVGTKDLEFYALREEG